MQDDMQNNYLNGLTYGKKDRWELQLGILF